MKCIKCNKDSKKKDRISSGGRCPSCHHSFVADPAEHGVTDMAIKSAEDEISAQGTLYFSKDQLKYQLQRKLKKKLRTFNIAVLVAAIILLFAIIKGGGFFVLAIFSGFIAIAILVGRFKCANSISKLDMLVFKWTVVNPHKKLLTAEKYKASKSSKRSSNLDDISFDRVLICDRNETVDFFLSNLFHFHYSCPVLGGNGYPEAIYEDMLTRLKQNPNLQVFLLHDYSPAGAACVRRVKTDPKWFGGQPLNIVDLGLNIGQKKLFKAMTIKKADRNKKISENAELSLFQPAVLVAMCGAAINEGLPFDFITSVAAADRSDGYG
ncbi:MAG: hypothetical protein EXR80_02810 [Methylococcales bacterium]|nr:hypothetical protein [Methylococcales bacterium]